jgi:hypothetical protein
MSARPYKRLPGHCWGFGSLWEAEDHLLLVKGVGLSENYHRFYFRDIQAITFCTTRWWIVIGSLLGVGTALLGLPAILWGGPLRWFFGLPALLLLAATVWNFWSGPSCRTTIQTAVQTLRIPSLHRKTKALAAIARVREKIQAAQSPPA